MVAASIFLAKFWSESALIGKLIVTYERILLIQLRQLGDILLTTPCIKAVRQNYPRAKLSFLSHAMGRLVLDGNPYVDELLLYRDDWTLAQHGRFLLDLRARRFDLVIDFMNNPRSALFTRVTGAADRVGFRSARFWAYTQHVAKGEDASYIGYRKLRLLQAAGMSGADLHELGEPFPSAEALTLDFPWFESDVGPYLHMLRTESALAQAPLRVVLSPTHRRLARRWPLANYAALADCLSENWGAAVIWIWGPGEEELIDTVRAQCRQTTYKAPPTTLRQLAALIANCDFFIGNSNGPSHIAVATGTPSLQLHGPTDPIAWTPPHGSRHRYLRAPFGPSQALPQIEDLSVASVTSSAAAMRSVVAEHAALLRERGPRRQWQAGAWR